MRQLNIFSLFFLAFLILFSCDKKTLHSNSLDGEKDEMTSESKSLKDRASMENVVNLQVEYFEKFSDLERIIDSINCASKTLKLDFYNEMKMVSFYLTILCKGVEIVDYKSRNVLIIHNDKILYGNDLLPLDDLESEILKHLNNYGESPIYSEGPQSFVIRISYDEYSLRKLPILLSRLKKLYVEHSDLYKSKLEFSRYIFPPSLSHKNNL